MRNTTKLFFFSFILIHCFSIGLHADNFATDTSDVAKISEEYTTDDLLRAVENGDLEKVKSLLANGMDPNSENFFGTTALILALNNGHIKIVELLLDQGADFKNQQEITPLVFAEKHGHTEIIKLFLNKMGCHYIREFNAGALLREAARTRDIEMIELLLKCGIEVDYTYTEESLRYVLNIAEDRGDTEIVQILRNYQGFLSWLMTEMQFTLDLMCRYREPIFISIMLTTLTYSIYQYLHID